jgi:hypothetical protein
VTDRKLSGGVVEGITALATACARRAQTELHSAADGVPELAFTLVHSAEMQGVAADLRARAAQALRAASSLSEAASSLETLADVVNGSVGLVTEAEKRPATRR